jgi:hypothetical protein
MSVKKDTIAWSNKEMEKQTLLGGRKEKCRKEKLLENNRSVEK